MAYMISMLIADIGGTNARFALADASGVHDPQVLQVAAFPGPLEAAAHYLAGKPRPARAVFAVAGPVGGDMFELTNFPWSFSVSALSAALGLDLTLINDFHAQALGIPDVDAKNLKPIGGGTAQPRSNIGIIGPGTGLGVGALVYGNGKYLAVPGEGGHVTLPVLNAREAAIRDWLLQTKYSHISAERVCSGKGLLNLYDAIRALDAKPLPDLAPEDITARAFDGTCDVCAECLDLMIAFLGRVAGNLALTTGALGGVYFTGGILPRLGIDWLTKSRLRAEFIAKGRHSGYMDRIPTFLVDDPFLPLKGLRQYGLDLTGDASRP
jgi:glucokinase